MAGLKKLDIDKCIMMHDLKQIKKEPAKKKIKTKRQLSIQIVKNKLLEGTQISIYTKLSRYERDGFKNEDKELTKAILSILEVERSDLVVKF